jgi:hypothetical protein
MPTLALSAGWSCRNLDMEITCHSKKCAISEGFTALSIIVSGRGVMNICAYSDCWIGHGKVFTSGQHILVSGHNLKWTGGAADDTDFIIAIDSSDKVGFIKGIGFAMPTICEKQ